MRLLFSKQLKEFLTLSKLLRPSHNVRYLFHPQFLEKVWKIYITYQIYSIYVLIYSQEKNFAFSPYNNVKFLFRVSKSAHG